MKGNMSNSKFLQYLINEAEQVKKANGAKILTANHIVVAMLQYFTNNDITTERSYDTTEITSVFITLKQNNLFNNSPDIVMMLSTKKDSYIDDFLYRQNVTEAQKKADEEGKEEVSADIFLKCIINAPTDEIKGMLKPSEPSKEKKMAIDLLNLSELETEDESVEPATKEDVDSKSYVSELTKKVKNMQKQLSSVVFGQDNAVSIVTSGYFQSELRALMDKKNKKPKTTFLFAGPPGVGKTFLAEQTSELLGLPFKRFDMSEYSERDAVMELCGTNKSYKGDKEGELTGFVNKNPYCILLFDEIEKAHYSAIHLFLQVLDGGRLRDINSGKEVDFSKTIIIFTTNAGRKVYEDSITPNLSGISRKTILKALESDVDPKTGISSFPAAICSRFATGNVVMFNHMEAHSLRKIAEKEIRRNVELFEQETGIKCEVADDIFSCVLFSEGGKVDARTLTSRAACFLSTELYELFRLISNEENQYKIEDIEKVKISLELPQKKEILKLFRDDSKGCVLSFGEDSMCERLNSAISKKGYTNIVADSIAEALEILNKQDVEMVFCDLYYGRQSQGLNKLNIEDISSDGRTFFRYVCEKTDVPLYVLSDEAHKYTEEEWFSLAEEGAREIVDVSSKEDVDATIEKILTQIHQQKSMIELAKSSKLIKYETAQLISDDGKTAEIKLFDIDLKTAIDAEDAGSILSNVSKPDVVFSDVIGADAAKDELKFFVEYLKNPKEYSSKGLGAPKGVLFYGPPGTGKTLLAKAVAGESNVTFISAEGNQFLKKYVGEGEEAVHKLFATARKYAPTIIFVDEIDAIAKERTGSEHSPESILTAFLAEMDGFKTDAKRPIFVLAATNFDVVPGTRKSLDEALLRRFDRTIFVDLPDKKARLEYINMRISKSPVFKISETEIENIAVRSTGLSLAKLASVFEFSMRIAIRNNADAVTDEIFEEAFESYNYGEEKKWDGSELKKTAFHEAGHAFLCWHAGETPAYLTVVARGNHGGYMLHGDNEQRGSYTKDMLLKRIRTALGGRAAELVFFGENDGLTTGASGDLSTATSIAQGIICSYGMEESMGMAVVRENELSNGTLSEKIRAAVNMILKNELDKAKEILGKNQVAVEKLVDALLQADHLGAKEIDAILSKYATQELN